MLAEATKKKKVELNFKLSKKQKIALGSKATEILYGGAAGGGKSHLARVLAILFCVLIPGLQVYFFRRLLPDLVKNHMEGSQGFRSLLALYVEAKLVTIVEDEIRFWNGSKIYLCHCKDEKDKWKYQGAEIHFLIVEEATQFTESIYRFLRNRVRCVGLNIPEKHKKLFPRILLTANPGNIGHDWVKRTFTDNGAFKIIEASEEEGKMLRQFIPAILDDNPYLLKDDPNYEFRLAGLGDPELVKAMRYGDWEILAGRFFSNFSVRKHVVRPHEIPKDWTRFRSFDWGSYQPFSVGWYAVADGTLDPYPRGAIIKYREWYGCSKPNVGIKLTPAEIAKGIIERETEEETEAIKTSLGDRAFFKEDGGESIAEIFYNYDRRLNFERADDSRIAGWQQVFLRLSGFEEDGHRPLLYFFENCIHTIRTIQSIQRDEKKVEDTMEGAEDHAVDETRYACMSRPHIVNSKVDNLTNSSEQEIRRILGLTEEED